MGVAECGPDLHVVGGGVVSDSEDDSVPRNAAVQSVNSSYPSDETGDDGTTAWTAAVDNLSSGELGFTVYAICEPASVGP